MKLSEKLKQVSQKLSSLHIDNARLEARIMISHALCMESDEIVMFPDLAIADDQDLCINQLVEQRINGKPIAYLINKKGFWNYTFDVNECTLIPRPDTETIIEAAIEYGLEYMQSPYVLDMGTGSGCIVCTIAKLNTTATCVATDISQDILNIASRNAKKLELSNKISFFISNWIDSIDKKFDIITCNPPYIPTETISSLSSNVKDYEPYIALNGGMDGLDHYRTISKNLSSVCNSNALILMEIGHNQAKQVIDIIASQAIKYIAKKKDLGGNDRCLIFQKYV